MKQYRVISLSNGKFGAEYKNWLGIWRRQQCGVYDEFEDYEADTIQAVHEQMAKWYPDKVVKTGVVRGTDMEVSTEWQRIIDESVEKSLEKRALNNQHNLKLDI